MFTIDCTVSYHNADGSKAKDDYVRKWEGLEKEHVVEHFEAAYSRWMTKLNRLSVDINKGRAPMPSTTKPVEMRMDIVISENGAKWCRALHEWPHMGEEQQSLLIGMLSGELSSMPEDVRGREKRASKK
jgi:hypothetical protein